MKKILVFLSVICGISFHAMGQSVSFVEDQTVQREISNFRGRNLSQTEIQGYRVQFYYTDDRRQMEQELARIRGSFPQFSPKWKQKTPFYYISGGAFESKLQALQALQNIRRQFPGAIIFEDLISKEELVSSLY